MKIDKALKKQRRYNKIFFIFMVFLSIFLPIITYLSYIRSIFILAFLILIEILIFVAVIGKFNSCILNFTLVNNKIKFKTGMFSGYSYIQCDKVSIVHTIKSNEEMEIIIVTTVKSKNKQSKPVNKDFIKIYTEAGNEYLRIKRRNSEKVYYFQIIKNGELNKYILLDNIYKNCVNAIYTSSAIENIKIARGQKEI